MPVSFILWLPACKHFAGKTSLAYRLQLADASHPAAIMTGFSTMKNFAALINMQTLKQRDIKTVVRM